MRIIIKIHTDTYINTHLSLGKLLHLASVLILILEPPPITHFKSLRINNQPTSPSRLLNYIATAAFAWRKFASKVTLAITTNQPYSAVVDTD